MTDVMIMAALCLKCQFVERHSVHGTPRKGVPICPMKLPVPTAYYALSPSVLLQRKALVHSALHGCLSIRQCDVGVMASTCEL